MAFSHDKPRFETGVDKFKFFSVNVTKTGSLPICWGKVPTKERGNISTHSPPPQYVTSVGQTLAFSLLKRLGANTTLRALVCRSKGTLMELHVAGLGN